jgi:hypothetical protein
MFHQSQRRGIPIIEDDSSALLFKLRQQEFIRQSIKQDRQDNISNLYNNFKQNIFHIIIGYIRDNYESLQDNNVILTIDNGKEGNSPPHLDIKKGNVRTWSMEQTLRQYIEGVPCYSKKLINMPDFVVNETLRYMHTNINTQETAPMVINDKTPFKPVLPSRINHGNNSYILINNIFPKDTMFIDNINRELNKFRPDLKISIETIIGDGSEIDINGNKLILCHNFTNLVIKNIEDDSSSTSVIDSSVTKPLPSQDDESSEEINLTENDI